MGSFSRKMVSFVLSVLMLFSFIPVFGNQAVYAGEGMPEIVNGINSDDTITAGNTVYVTMSSLENYVSSDFEAYYKQGKVKCYFVVGDEDHEVSLSGGKFSYLTRNADVGKELYFLIMTQGDFDAFANRNTPFHTIKASGDPFIDIDGNMTSDGKITVVGDAGSGSRTFKSLNICSNTTGSSEKTIDFYSTGISGQKSFTKVVDMSEYPSGWYLLKAELSDGYVYYESLVPSLIYEKPAIKKNSNFFSTGYNYICFSPYFTVPFDVHSGEKIFGYIYFQLYDTKTKKWGDVYGPYDSYQKLKTQYFIGTKGKSGSTKLAANREYKIRVFYAKDAYYAGNNYPLIGPYSNIVTLKTGKSAKPAIKAVTVKATKVKKVKLIQHAHWDISGKWIPYKESYTYTTTYKVTVKLKKKPGTAGICIGTKKCKGNKTKYTATFTDTGKLKGKKVKVQICTYNDASTGAYGPAVTKKVKMR